MFSDLARRAVLLSAILALSGCSEVKSLFASEPPTCSDERVVGTLKAIYAEMELNVDASVGQLIKAVGGAPLGQAISQRTGFAEKLIDLQMIVSEGYDQAAKKRSCKAQATLKDGSPKLVSYSVQLEDGKRDSFIVHATSAPSSSFDQEANYKAVGAALAELYKEKIASTQEAEQKALREKDEAELTALANEYKTAKQEAGKAWATASAELKQEHPAVGASIAGDFLSDCPKDQNDKTAQRAKEFLNCRIQAAKNIVSDIQRAETYSGNQ